MYSFRRRHRPIYIPTQQTRTGRSHRAQERTAKHAAYNRTRRQTNRFMSKSRSRSRNRNNTVKTYRGGFFEKFVTDLKKAF